MWLWRRMEKISWTAKVSNSEVLSRVMEDRCIVNTIKQRKRKWLGHVLRHDVLLRRTGTFIAYLTHQLCLLLPLVRLPNILPSRGRRRLQLMSKICYEGNSYKSVKKWAEDRCLWRVFEMEVNDLLYIAVHQKKKDVFERNIPSYCKHCSVWFFVCCSLYCNMSSAKVVHIVELMLFSVDGALPWLATNTSVQELFWWRRQSTDGCLRESQCEWIRWNRCMYPSMHFLYCLYSVIVV